MATTTPRLCSLRHFAASPACSSTNWSMTPSRPKWAVSSTRLHCRPAFREGKEDDESRGRALAFLSQTHDFVETRFFAYTARGAPGAKPTKVSHGYRAVHRQRSEVQRCGAVHEGHPPVPDVRVLGPGGTDLGLSRGVL